MIFDITITLDTSSVSVTATDDIDIVITLDAEQIPPASICSQIDDCLSIPEADGSYVLTITNNVISWEEFSATGLVDGNGTTINGNKVDLGGDVIQDTILLFDPSQFLFVIGDTNTERTLYFGNAQGNGDYLFGASGYDSASITGGAFQLDSSDNITLNAANNFDLSIGNIGNIVTDSGDYKTQITLEPNEVEKAVVVKLFKEQDFEVGFAAIDDGINKYSNIYYGVLDENNNITDVSRVAATDNEIHGRKFITVGGNYNGFHCNSTYTQLEYDKVAEDDQTTGTLFVLDADGVSHYQGGAVLNQFDNSGFIYIGSKNVDGSWRLATSGGNLVIEKREAGIWVTKQTLV